MEVFDQRAEVCGVEADQIQNVTGLAMRTVDDYLAPNWFEQVADAGRPGVAHNGPFRSSYWSNKRVVVAIDAYPADQNLIRLWDATR